MKYWLAVLLGGWLLMAEAGEVRLSGNEQRLLLTPWLAVREDPSARLTVARIVADQSVGFHAIAPRKLPVGYYSSSAFWYHATLTSRASMPRVFWLEAGEPRLREVDFYLWQQARWSSMRSGTGLPFSARPVAALASMFPVSLAPGESVQFYVRIASPTILTKSFTLWAPMAYLQANALDTLIDGLLFGAFLMVIGYSVVIAFAVRKWNFLYLAAATLFYLLYQLAARGYGLMYLWPDSPWWSSVALAPYLMVATPLAMLHQRPLLQLSTLTPRGDRCLLACCWAMFLLIPLSIFVDYRFAVHAYQFLVTVTLAGLAVISVGGYVRRLQAVRIYVLVTALLALICAPLTLYLEDQHIHTVLIKLVPVIGVLLMLLFWTYALHFHFDHLRQQREHAQDELLANRVSERTRLEHTVAERTGQLQDALSQANTANQAKSMLLAHISHDLRAPLSTIIGYARQWWQQAGDKTAPLAIERNARNQLMLIDDLLEYACIDLNEAVLHPQPGCLPDFVREVGKDARQLAGQAGLAFDLILDASLPVQVEADFKRLRQVLMNLLSNAAKFTVSGGIILRVGTPTPPRIRFEVIDTGIGLSGTERVKIFEPFEFGEAGGKISGVGLGLAISRHYVEKMGGDLGLDSEPGYGSRFHFELLLPLEAPHL